MESSQIAHERRGGRLAVKHAIGIVQSLGAWGASQEGWTIHCTAHQTIRKLQTLWSVKSGFFFKTLTWSPLVAPLITKRQTQSKTHYTETGCSSDQDLPGIQIFRFWKMVAKLYEATRRLSLLSNASWDLCHFKYIATMTVKMSKIHTQP